MSSLKHILLLTVTFILGFFTNAQPKQKTFENDGLRFRIIITIKFLAASQVEGTVTLDEYQEFSGVPNRFVNFTGIVEKDEFKIRFLGDKPESGDEWLDKPWKIKKVNGKEILYIALSSWDHETNTWNEGVEAFYDSTQTEKTTIGKIYTVVTNKSYFYTYPRDDAKRKAYVQKGDEVEAALQEQDANGWVKAKFINTSGKSTEGYLKPSTLEVKNNASKNMPLLAAERNFLKIGDLIPMYLKKETNISLVLQDLKKINQNWEYIGSDEDEIDFSNENNDELFGVYNTKSLCKYLFFDKENFSQIVHGIKERGYVFKKGYKNKFGTEIRIYGTSQLYIRTSVLHLPYGKMGYGFYISEREINLEQVPD